MKHDTLEKGQVPGYMKDVICTCPLNLLYFLSYSKRNPQGHFPSTNLQSSVLAGLTALLNFKIEEAALLGYGT